MLLLGIFPDTIGQPYYTSYQCEHLIYFRGLEVFPMRLASNGIIPVDLYLEFVYTQLFYDFEHFIQCSSLTKNGCQYYIFFCCWKHDGVRLIAESVLEKVISDNIIFEIKIYIFCLFSFLIDCKWFVKIHGYHDNWKTKAFF